MPELPEVETIKRVIEPQIKGLTIEEAAVRRPEVIAYPGTDEFCSRLKGQTISIPAEVEDVEAFMEQFAKTFEQIHEITELRNSGKA